MGSLRWKFGRTGKRLPFVDFWVPRFRWELVEWLSRRFPDDSGKFERWRKKRLLAVYFRVRERDG